MSIQTPEPMNEEARSMLKEMFGDAVAEDKKTILFHDMKGMNNRNMGDVARAAGQVVTAELNEIGDVKELSDGSQYKLETNGWKKI